DQRWRHGFENVARAGYTADGAGCRSSHQGGRDCPDLFTNLVDEAAQTVSLMTGRTKKDIVLEIIRDIGGSKSPIDESTRIYQDLQISGDDAFEVIERIHKECGTSFRQLDFHEYFPNETDAIFYHIMQLFGWTWKKKTMTVGELLRAVEAGNWVEK